MTVAFEAFTAQCDVSRETFSRLEIYAGLLNKWNPAINLVSKNTLNDLWTRHILDSAQVFDVAPDSAKGWSDLGSGGGFPGMVVAILAKEKRPELSFNCVESDQRKAAFLRTVARETGVDVKIHADRIEKVAPLHADVLSARALAPLDILFEFAEMHLAPSGVALFQKGASYQQEIDAARHRWDFSETVIPSITESQAVILEIKGITRV